MGRGCGSTYVVDPGGGALVPLAVGREAVDHVEHARQAQHWNTHRGQSALHLLVRMITAYWSK